MEELIDKMQKAIDKELKLCADEMRIATYNLKTSNRATDRAIAKAEIEQIKERIATLCYLSAICY